MKASMHILISIICFSISIFFLYSSYYLNDPIPEGQKWFYENNIHHNYIEKNLPSYTIDPFDYYTSWLEAVIIWVCMGLGIWVMIPVFKTAGKEIYKYDER